MNVVLHIFVKVITFILFAWVLALLHLTLALICSPLLLCGFTLTHYHLTLAYVCVFPIGVEFVDRDQNDMRIKPQLTYSRRQYLEA